jgi:MFS family permease
MGFFTDAYDLFVIGVVATLVTKQWQITGSQKSLLTSLALLTSAVGAIVFGRVADRLGREDLRIRGSHPGGRGHRLGILSRHLVVDRVPGRTGIWYRRRLPDQRHHYE